MNNNWTSHRIAEMRHQMAGPCLSPLADYRQDILSLLGALEEARQERKVILQRLRTLVGGWRVDGPMDHEQDIAAVYAFCADEVAEIVDDYVAP